MTYPSEPSSLDIVVGIGSVPMGYGLNTSQLVALFYKVVECLTVGG